MMGFVLICNIEILHNSARYLAFITHCTVERIYDSVNGRIYIHIVFLCLLECVNVIFKEVSKSLIDVHKIIS